ncbi:MAG: hypothetical protein JRJ29_08115 [Deltaproteobacteria bacterium]|nr:hypothetical protein [Deltaproteobacteria bacterium]
MANSEIQKYVDVALRRKYWIVIPFLLVLLGGLTYALVAPRIYEAQTLILVQPQRVPEDFVKPIVSIGIEARLPTITQQVTSRTNLEKLISQYNLFDFKTGAVIDEKVLLFRKRITIEVSRGRGRGTEANAFTIRVRYEDPKKAMLVTNALASNFILENLKIREAQAMGTSAFLADELRSIQRKIKKKEEDLKLYREKYMGGLPEQLETNLKILERLQAQLDQLQTTLANAEDRRLILQREAQRQEEGLVLAGPTLAGGGGVSDLARLKAELASLEAKYTNKHPDVIRLKEMIARLEKRQSGVKDETSNTTSVPESSIASREVRQQISELEVEIRLRKQEIQNTKAQVKWYQKKVEETPKREQELLTLTRDYENLKELYKSLLNRKLEAEIAVSMESKQQGEQFRVLDPAKEPLNPVSPKMKKVLLLTLVLAIGLGCGLAYAVEMMDTSFRTPEEVEKELEIPVLVSMPIWYTKGEMRRQKAVGILKATSVAVGFIAGAVAIVSATRGLDSVIAFVKRFLDIT